MEKEEEWVADSNEKGEASEATIVESVLNEQKQQSSDEETKEQNEVEAITVKATQLLDLQIEEIVCIDDSNVALINYFGKKVEQTGRLKATNLKISFLVVNREEVEEVYFQIPLGYLLKVERYIEDKVNSSIDVTIKYGISFRIKYSDPKGEICVKTHKLIAHLIETAVKIPCEYGAKLPQNLRCNSIREVGEGFSEAHLYENQGWKRLPNYPERFRVPLPYLSRNNPEERMMVLSLVYHNGKEEVALWRTGPGRGDPSEEQWLAQAKNNPKVLTVEIKNKGIGSPRSLAGRVVEMQSLPQLRESFFQLVRLAYHSHDSLKWISQLMSTRWYEQVGTLLQEASILVNQLINHPVQITLLSDTEVRSAQLAALVQVLLFPEYRTIKGFGQLVERQFLQWGATRQVLKKQPEPERGPALIQFFDAVFQLTTIYPLSFQYSQSYLVFLAEQVYSNRFGNFLLISRTIKEEERESLMKCGCVWRILDKWLQSNEIACYYRNPYYVDFKECDIYELKQTPSVKQLKIWNGFFFKKFRENNSDYHMFHRYNQLNAKHFHNKIATDELRKQLGTMLKTLQQRKQVLSQLKALE